VTGKIHTALAREAIAGLPEGAEHGKSPAPERVYVPSSHAKAMDPDIMLVTGIRGAGKTFWWSALQNTAVRELVYRSESQLPLRAPAEFTAGFGIKQDWKQYPDKDMLKSLLHSGFEPRIIWRTIQARQIAPEDHPLRRESDWKARVTYTKQDPEAIAKLFQEADHRYDKDRRFHVMLFDSLDRCADDWKDMFRLIRGLMQAAIDTRPYRRLRVKIFLRTDQVDENRIADFPDASKVLASSIELSWTSNELYGLLWHNLINSPNSLNFRRFLQPFRCTSIESGNEHLFMVSRKLISSDESLREKFHVVAGPWMGRNAKRGFPYTWIPNHLGDTEGRVSPRSFLEALREAAKDTAEHYTDHRYALHFESIKRGVQKASRIRVAEIREDYPWMHRVLEPLDRITVPCAFSDIEARWGNEKILERLTEDIGQNEVKLPPRHIDDGANGIRRDLESLGVFLRLRDGRVNIPDVFRVGYGLGRKGGVRPAR